MDIASSPSTESRPVPPNLSSYTNYREYLRDFYAYKVAQHPGPVGAYTYKDFSAAADVRSPTYLKLIIDGERNLSPATAKKFSRALNLDKEGTTEFLLLVAYTQALDPLERNRHLKSLNEYRMKMRRKRGEVQPTANTEAVPRWVTWVLLALADQKDSDFSIDGIRRSLGDRVSIDDVRRGLQQLFDSKALQLDENGNVKKGLVPATQEEISPEMVRKIQSELMYLGLESLMNGSPNEREVGTLTVCLTEAEFEKLKFELRHLRKRVLKDTLIARERSKGDRVYQLNIQLFPLTKL